MLGHAHLGAVQRQRPRVRIIVSDVEPPRPEAAAVIESAFAELEPVIGARERAPPSGGQGPATNGAAGRRC
jgi:hypothetical protein